MEETIKIVECPRDAWQGLQAQLPAEVKASYLRKLIHAGFTHIDAVSFVSPAAVPQMADSEHVLEILDPPDDVEIIGIVVNRKGAERAIATGAVRTLGFPYSISPEFLRRNQHQTHEESLRELDTVRAMADEAGLIVVAYLSMAFGNPYSDAWSVAAMIAGCEQLVRVGIRQISLADTVGLATPGQIAEALRECSRHFQRLSSACISTHGETRLRRALAPPSKPAADGSMRLWEDLAVAPLPRMRWWGTSPLRSYSRNWAGAAQSFPVLGRSTN